MSLSREELERMQKTLQTAFDLAQKKMVYAHERQHIGYIHSGIPAAVAQTALALLENNRQQRELEAEEKDGKPKLPRP